MPAIVITLRESDGVSWRIKASSLDDAWRQVSVAEARGSKLEHLIDLENGTCHMGQALVTLRASRAPLFTISAAGEGSCLIVR